MSILRIPDDNSPALRLAYVRCLQRLSPAERREELELLRVELHCALGVDIAIWERGILE